MGAFHFSQLVIPLMLEHPTGGSLIFRCASAVEAFRGLSADPPL